MKDISDIHIITYKFATLGNDVRKRAAEGVERGWKIRTYKKIDMRVEDMPAENENMSLLPRREREKKAKEFFYSVIRGKLEPLQKYVAEVEEGSAWKMRLELTREKLHVTMRRSPDVQTGVGSYSETLNFGYDKNFVKAYCLVRMLEMLKDYEESRKKEKFRFPRIELKEMMEAENKSIFRQIDRPERSSKDFTSITRHLLVMYEIFGSMQKERKNDSEYLRYGYSLKDNLQIIIE